MCSQLFLSAWRSLLATAVLLVGLAAPAWAAGSAMQELCLKDEACRTHYANADEAYRAGKLPEAIEAYEAAYRQVQIPVFLFNLGRLHQRLGNLDEAAEHFRRYLAAGMDEDPAQRQRAQDYLREIQEQKPAPAAEPAAIPVPVPAPAEKRPVYKTWWFWTAAVGGAVVVGAAIGLGVGLGVHRVTVPDDATGYRPSF